MTTPDASAERTDSEDLGEIVGTVILQGATFGKGVDGAPQVFFAVNGRPARFYAVDVETLKPVFSQELPDFDVVWAITTGPDGKVYFSGTRDGRVYRYDPLAMQIKDLGANGIDDPWVWDMVAAPDGILYGGTSPRAQVFEFDPRTGESRRFAAGVTGESYVRGLGVTERHVYLCVGMRAHLFRVDRESGEVEELPVPNRGRPGSSISRAWEYGGRVLARSGGSRLFVLDSDTLDVIRGAENFLHFDYMLSPPAPDDPDRIYFKRGSSLFTYNLKTDEVEEVESDGLLPAHPLRGLDWVSMSGGDDGDRTFLVGLTEFGEMFLYNPRDCTVKVDTPAVEPQGVLIQSLAKGADGRIYAGGYQGGMSIFDPETQEVVAALPSLPQPEGIGFLKDEVFFGTYSGARIYRYDPAQPLDLLESPEGNPGLVYEIGYGQDRPFAFASTDRQLFIGTVPGYGRLGGALAVYDSNADFWQTFPEPIANQSIIGLLWHNGRLYGSTSVFGGLGGAPSEDRAKVFIWDTEKEEVVREVVPEIPGIDVPPKAIGALSVGPDGRLWAAAQGTLFVMDPETLEVEQAKMIYPSNWNVRHYWRPVLLRWGEDGLLYTTLNRRLTVLDPENWQVVHRGEPSHLLELDEWGFVYFGNESRLWRKPLLGKIHQ